MKLHYLLIVLLLLPFASAGTLISGSTVQVNSNYGGFSNLSLLGTWSSAPSANDRIIITNANLPEPYSITKDITVEVLAPQIAQRVRPTQQVFLYQLTYVSKQYNYNPLNGYPKGCTDAIEADRAISYKNMQVVTPYIYQGVFIGVCKAQFVLQAPANGWVSPVSPTSLDYSQQVSFDNGAVVLKLVKDDKTTQLSDNVPNFAKVTLVGMSGWLNSPLDTNNVYVFQTDGTGANRGSWVLFQDNTGPAIWQSKLRDINAAFNDYNLKKLDYNQFSAREEQLVREANNEALRIQSSQYNKPSAWQNKADLTAIKYNGNDLIVPLKNEQQGAIFVPQIQLLLSGEKFGLYIPTGIPKIVTADTSVSFDETKQGLLKYTVKNDGNDVGTFSVQGICDGSDVTAETDVFSMKAGESKSSTLLITAKSSKTSDQTVKCKLQLKEQSTQKYVEKDFSVTIIAKQACVQGEETDPKISGNGASQVVYQLNSKCEVISTKTCETTGHQFEKKDGVWTCVEKKAACGSDCPPDTEEKKFNGLLFIVTIVLAFIGGGLAFSFTSPLGGAKIGSFPIGTIMRIAAFLLVFGLIFIGVPMLVNWVIGLFSLPALSLW